MRGKIRIPIGDMFLVAEVNDWNDEMPAEMYIYLENQVGVMWQDIALVREHYHFLMNQGCVRDPSLIDIKVWGDSENEDYTHEFTVGIWGQEEDE